MNQVIIDDIIRDGNRMFGVTGAVDIGTVSESANPGSLTSRVEVFIGNERRSIYVKTIAAEGGVNDKIKADVVREYEILSALYGQFEQQPHLSVVRPVAVYPEQRVIITEEAPGPTLQIPVGKAIRAGLFSRDIGRTRNYCLLAGEWLSRFQQLTDRGTGGFQTGELVRYCDARLLKLQSRQGSGIGEGLRQRVLAWIHATCDQIVEKDNSISGCHNDYAPHNMIAQDGRLCVLDFGYFDYDSTIYDVCRFWHRLETFKADPSVSSRRTQLLQDAFLEGYGGSVDIGSAPSRLAMCRYTIASMYTICNGGEGSYIRNYFSRRAYRKYLDWLVRQCT